MKHSKSLIVATVSFVAIKLIGSPLISAVVFTTRIRAFYYISYSLTFISLVLIALCVFRIKKYVSEKEIQRDDSEIASINVFRSVVLPLFLILFAIFLDSALNTAMGFPYHGRNANIVPPYLHYLPPFIAMLLVGILHGKRGWLLGILVGCIEASRMIVDGYIIYSIANHMTLFEYMGVLIRSHVSYAIWIGSNLISTTLGGFLGGMMRYQIDLILQSRISLIPRRKIGRVFLTTILIMIAVCIVAGSIIYSQYAFSNKKQVPFNLWCKTFEGECMSFQPTKDGGFIFVGRVDQPKGKYSYLMKIDSDGDTLWNRKYSDVLLRMAVQTSDGKYIVTGSKETADNKSDISLMKANFDGTILWEKSLGGEQVDIGISVIETSAGDFVIAGISDSNAAILIKTDDKGDPIWQRGYWSDNSLGKFTFFGYSMLETSDKGYIVSASDGEKMHLVKVNENGEHEWTSMSLCESYNGNASSLVKTYDDFYAITGYFFGQSKTDDVCLVKVDGKGERIWRKTYGEKGMDYGHDVKQTPDSGLIIAGTTTQIRSFPKYTPQFIKRICSKYTFISDYLFDGTSGVQTNLFILKTDKEGNELWKQMLGGMASAEPNGICFGGEYNYFFIQNTMDGGYTVAGQISLHGFRYIDFYIRKLK